jgi:hypothetical protein
VKIAIRQEVAVAPARALAAYGSPAFYDGRAPRDGIEVLGVVRHEDAGDRVLIEVHFAFTGSVSSAVRAVIDHKKMTWVTRTELRPAEGRSEWLVVPDHYPDRLRAHGTYRFEEGGAGPDSTVITVAGDLKVSVPIVGRTVERVIVSGLQSYIAEEVAAIPDLHPS